MPVLRSPILTLDTSAGVMPPPYLREGEGERGRERGGERGRKVIIKVRGSRVPQ